MPTANFADLLKAPTGSVERPKLIPAGFYRSIIAEHTFGKSREKQTPYIEFQFKLIGPEGNEDDPDFDNAFDEAGGLDGLMKRRAMKKTFWLTPDALFMLDEFLIGAAKAPEGIPQDEAIPQIMNTEVLLQIVHVPSNKREGEFWTDVGDIATLDA